MMSVTPFCYTDSKMYSENYTFPPRTSSPMIKQAAVEMVRELRSSADIGAMVLPRANRLVLPTTGAERCRVT